MSKAKGKIQEKIEEKLLDQRKVFLWGQVDDDSAKHVIDPRPMVGDALRSRIGTSDRHNQVRPSDRWGVEHRGITYAIT